MRQDGLRWERTAILHRSACWGGISCPQARAGLQGRRGPLLVHASSNPFKIDCYTLDKWSQYWATIEPPHNLTFFGRALELQSHIHPLPATHHHGFIVHTLCSSSHHSSSQTATPAPRAGNQQKRGAVTILIIVKPSRKAPTNHRHVKTHPNEYLQLKGISGT